MKHQQQEKPNQAAHCAKRSSEEPLVPLRHSEPPVYQLQRTLGNQAVLHLLRSGVLQAKLTVSRPDDIYEQEADRAADEVMGMPEPAIQPKPG